MITLVECNVLLTSPCQNGGTCTNIEPLEDSVDYTCECADGYEGGNPTPVRMCGK